MYPCTHCSRSFATQGELTRHMAAVKAMATRAGRPVGTAPSRRGRRPFAPPFATPPPPASNPWNAPPPPATPSPSTPPPPKAPLWTARPKPTIEDARAEVLVALENLYALQCKATGITDEKRNTFEKYQKALTRALAPSPDPLMRNEAETALRVAAIHLVKITF